MKVSPKGEKKTQGNPTESHKYPFFSSFIHSNLTLWEFVSPFQHLHGLILLDLLMH